MPISVVSLLVYPTLPHRQPLVLPLPPSPFTSPVTFPLRSRSVLVRNSHQAQPTKPLAAVHQTKSPKKKLISDAKQSPPDHRLFVSLPDDHAAKKIDSYAIFSRRNWKAIDTDKFLGFVSISLKDKHWMRLPETPSPSDIDNAVNHLLDIVQRAAQESTPWARPSTWARQGWTPECTEAVKTSRRLRRRYVRPHNDED